MDSLARLHTRLQSLVIFRNLLSDGVVQLLLSLLDTENAPLWERVSRYGAFASALLQKTENFSDYLWGLIVYDPNFYIAAWARGERTSPALKECLQKELQLLQELSQLSAGTVQAALGYDGYLPEWRNRPADFPADYMALLESAHTGGFGMYAKYRAFTLNGQALVPVSAPDPVRLSDLSGYEAQRRIVLDNTLALLSGKPAANTLLYGDAGTGKSSCVKALLNEYAPMGLRLIEIRRDQLLHIPEVASSLNGNPLKFILFIDDLTLSADSEELGALKSVLEGAVWKRSQNVILYATSNRRHLIHETFSQREGDEIHREETVQEQVSFSDRFGLAVRFFRPDKEEYLSIVHALARQYALGPDVDLDLKAERFAMEKGGRSPRAARQLVEMLKSREGTSR